MPWYRWQAYIEEWAADPYPGVILIDPTKVQRSASSPEEELDALASLGITVRQH